jgi:hypothetical protein
MHKPANKFYHQRRNSTHAIKLVEMDDHSLSIINISHHHLIPFAGSIVSHATSYVDYINVYNTAYTVPVVSMGNFATE